jgi:hypothetical protein
MIKLLTILFLFAGNISLAQTADQLDKDNGFMNIHLLSSVDTLPDFISIFKDPDINNQKYEFAMLGSQYSYNGNKYKSFGEARISKIFLTTDPDEGLISEIKVFCEHDSSVLSALVKMYGEPRDQFRPMIIEDRKAIMTVTRWQAGNVRLIFTAKKFYNKKDSDESNTPDFMYLFITSREADKLKDQ